MPQVTIQINAPDHALDQELLPLDLAPSATVKDVKSMVSAGTGFDIDKLQFYLNGQPLVNDNNTLEQAGIRDGELLAMLVREDSMPPRQSHGQGQGQGQGQGARPPQRPGRAQQGGGRAAGAGSGMSPEEIETLRLSTLGNADALRQVQERDPDLAGALHDPILFREKFHEKLREADNRERERREQMQLLNDDPFNVEAQRKIEEIIRQDRVMENLQYAYEHNPEVFGRVSMLYINTRVNGHNVKAFVDSGAQTTIMSPSCAEACGIMRLIDTRYSGVARGVGTAKILGRVHSADITIGNQVMPCSFTVMEGKDVDLLLGLDMLKRYQATIDLRQNKLVFENNEVGFLPESEIPQWQEENEPKIQGPNGTEIGAQSGTVQQSGAASSSSSSQTNFKGSGKTLGSPGPSAATSAPQPAVHPTPGATSAGAGSAPPPRASSHSSEKIQQLVSLGFSQQEAISALDATGGNVEYAAGLLFQS